VLLLGLGGTLSAQVTSPALLWQLADRAMQSQRWDDAEKAWQLLLRQPQWPFPQSRDYAVLSLSQALWRQARLTDARQVLVAHLATRPGLTWNPRAVAHLAVIDFDLHGPAGLDRHLAAYLDDPLRPTSDATHFAYAAAAALGGIDPVDQALTRYLQMRPTHPRSAELRLLKLELLASAGNHEEVWTLASQWLLQHADPRLEMPLIMRLADADARLGAPDLAVALLTDALAALPQAAELQPLRETYRQQIERGHARKTDITKNLTATLDDPRRTDSDDRALLARMAQGDIPGAAYWVDDALLAYLAANPQHPRRLALLVQHAWVMTLAGDQRAAIKRVQTILPALTGTPYEVQALSLLAEAYARLGNFHQAGELIAHLPPGQVNEHWTLQTLAYFRRAGDLDNAKAVAAQIGDRPAASPILVDALYWICVQTAEIEHSAAAVQPWLDKLISIAAEDNRAAQIRQLVRELPQ